jgi:hypothetical protein
MQDRMPYLLLEIFLLLSFPSIFHIPDYFSSYTLMEEHLKYHKFLNGGSRKILTSTAFFSKSFRNQERCPLNLKLYPEAKCNEHIQCSKKHSIVSRQTY